MFWSMNYLPIWSLFENPYLNSFLAWSYSNSCFFYSLKFLVLLPLKQIKRHHRNPLMLSRLLSYYLVRQPCCTTCNVMEMKGIMLSWSNWQEHIILKSLLLTHVGVVIGICSDSNSCEDYITMLLILSL